MGTRIEVEPVEAPADEPVAVRVRGVPPGRRVTLRAEARRGSGLAWRSQVEFLADESATVDLARQAPEAGSYQGIEPMGLFWSILPEPAAPSLAEVYASLDPITVTLAVEVEGQPVARESLRRLVAGPNVVRTPVRDAGLVAALFRPSRGGPHPGIVVLGGSEGGLFESPAALSPPRLRRPRSRLLRDRAPA